MLALKPPRNTPYLKVWFRPLQGNVKRHHHGCAMLVPERTPQGTRIPELLTAVISASSIREVAKQPCR